MVKRRRRTRRRRTRRRIQRGGACGCPKAIDNSPLPTPPWLPPGRMYEPGGVNGLTDGYYYGVEVSQKLPDPINQTNLGQMKGGSRARRRGGRRRLADSVFDDVMGFSRPRREHKKKKKNAVAHMKAAATAALKGATTASKKIAKALRRGDFGIKEEIKAQVSWKGGRRKRRRTRRRRRRTRRRRRARRRRA